MVLEKTLESPLDCKVIQSILKEISPEYSLEELMLKLKLQYLYVKYWLWKWLWCWERLKSGEVDDIGWVGWHYWLNVYKFEWALGDGDGQGSLVWCSSWDHKELELTELLNWTMFVIAFLLRSKSLLISWRQSPSAVIMEYRNIKSSHTSHCLPNYLPWSYGTRYLEPSFFVVVDM